MNQDKKRDVIRPYVVDGIQEYDNPMPGWWISLFWATIIFGVGYLVYFHGLSGNTLEHEFAADMKAAQTTASQPSSGGGQAGGSLSDQVKDPTNIAEGKKVYDTNCIPCHGPAGEGIVGPNLTDNHWIHGGSPENVLAVIANGVVEKGMLAWKRCWAMQSYAGYRFVLSLKGTNPPTAKGRREHPTKGTDRCRTWSRILTNCGRRRYRRGQTRWIYPDRRPGPLQISPQTVGGPDHILFGGPLCTDSGAPSDPL